MLSDNEMRDSLYQSVYEEFVGPIDPESRQILEWVKPNKIYSAGILYPIGSEYGEFEDNVSFDGDKAYPHTETDEIAPSIKVERTSKTYKISDEDEPVSLSNSDHQSAISMTFAIEAGAQINILVSAARYEKTEENGHPAYMRVPIKEEITVPSLPSESKPLRFLIGSTKLEAMLVYRYELEGVNIYTAALRNSAHSKDPSRASYKECYYQVGFKLESSDGFCPIPSPQTNSTSATEEDRSKELIYRNIKNYAIGHGCATDWQSGPRPKWLKTEIMPISETVPIKTTVDGLPVSYFDMYQYSEPSNWEETRKELLDLCDLYDSWIDDIVKQADILAPQYQRAAKENIGKCRSCLIRIREGIQILNDNPLAKASFALANEAMLDQYLHYSVVSNECDTVRKPAKGIRFWRPFQIAFLVMNLKSIVDSHSNDRNLLDLIWFPTGGGKTEAYLGLTAFVLIFERLNKESVVCTSVIMRYTLRLLSAQQFDRAASLICALESMRRKDEKRLGIKPFSIGLWVGSGASPNKWKDAIDIKNNLRKGITNDEKGTIPVTCCPWCGTTMGVKGTGYKESLHDGAKILKFVCPNSECEFSDKYNSLPLKVVDEGIYQDPPSLLLGTVDKFAMIPFNSESYKIFGIDENGERSSAPKLIIQDELHLISGPLGSMVSHYETLVSDLCSYTDENGSMVRPKIIASTATVSHAKEQCHELFACGMDNVLQFPPSGIDYEDSFFSKLDFDRHGRKYVGLYIPNLSYATASIRLYAQLLWTPATWNLEKDDTGDSYWTVVGYYGTTRELGQAATWADSDIQERLYEKKRSCKGKKARYLNKFTELTGRIDAPEVRKGLDDLKIPRSEKGCIDLCLATNMISVGLDVGRLGLMVMAGQPKETSEYIQASSRVGRGESKGMVFVVYGTQRPRDRSHYENFKNYHESFYKQVEPSSVTAFCPQVRDRAMPGTVIGMYRANHKLDSDINDPNPEDTDMIKSRILQRVKLIDPDEVDDTEEQIDDILEHWHSYRHERWEERNIEKDKIGDAVPLVYPRGVQPLDCWGDAGFPLPTSMRNVDKECEVTVLGRYRCDNDIEDE